MRMPGHGPPTLPGRHVGDTTKPRPGKVSNQPYHNAAVKSKKSESHSNSHQNSNGQFWVDRVASELHARSGYSTAWGTLVDPRLYSDRQKRCWEDPPSAPKYSPFSILKAPGGDPTGRDPKEPRPQIRLTEKITGDRTFHRNPHYVAARAPTVPPSAGTLPKSHRGVLPLNNHSHRKRAPGAAAGTAGYPPTENSDYGWRRYTLETFGSTSANFSRSAWGVA
ncbi:hypothetical protein HDU89_003237 [Geranomyces variabilis]|nr:hypothetical protein HDU89_003237 [Geranomyces variabilis]